MLALRILPSNSLALSQHLVAGCPASLSEAIRCPMQLMGNLDFPQAVEEIQQAVKWLREQGAPKVGAIHRVS